MAEKVEDPLRGLYRQLGIPLAGEGNFADVKPNTVIKQWPGPFEQVREAFDPEYASAKKLAITQQGMMDDFVKSAQAFKALQSTQVPTVGDAQTLFPGHKELIPESAYKTTPQAPLQANEMSVLQSVNRETIPDNRFQGPMPGVMTPLGEAAVKWFGATNESPLNREDNKAFAEKGPEFYQEGARPTRVAETGVYGPDMAPSQATQLDKNMALPPSFQAQLGAMQHQLSQRQVAPHTPTEAEIMLQNQQRLEQIIATGKETYPGERGLLESRLSIFNKENRPNSVPALTDEAKLKQEQAKGKFAEQHEEADIGVKQSQKTLNEAHTTDSNTWRQAKLEEIMGRTALHRSQGNLGAAKAELAAFAEQLRLDERTWKIFSGIMLTGDLDDDSKRAVLKPLLERSGELTVNPNPPGIFDTLRGREYGSGISIQPTPGVTPYQWTNPSGQHGSISNTTPTAPLPPTQPEGANDDRAAAKKLYDSMKDGETRMFRGNKYIRRNGKLEPVKE